MIELTADQKKLFALVIAEKDIEPPNDTELSMDEVDVVWELVDLELVEEKHIPGDETSWVFRPTAEGLKFYEENK